MKRTALALLLCLFVGSAWAQSAPVILPSGCGTASFTNGVPYLTMDSTGRLCGTLGTTGAIGYVGGFDGAVPVAPTIQAASYASGNAMGALQTVAVFRATAQPSGILNSVLLAWRGTETTPVTFFIFDTNPTGSTCTDKSAFSLAAADIPKLAIQPFTLTAAAPAVGTTATSATSSFTPVSIKNQDGTPTVNLYVCTVIGGTVTPAVGDLTYKISIALD